MARGSDLRLSPRPREENKLSPVRCLGKRAANCGSCIHVCCYFYKQRGSVSLEILHLAFKRQIILMGVYEPGFQEPQHHCWDEVSFIGSDLQTTLNSSRARLFPFRKLARTNFLLLLQGEAKETINIVFQDRIAAKKDAETRIPRLLSTKNMADFSTEQPHRHGNKTEFVAFACRYYSVFRKEALSNLICLLCLGREVHIQEKS